MKWLAMSSFLVLTINPLIAGPREQAKRMHDRLAGTHPSETVLNQMVDAINGTSSLHPTITDPFLKAAYIAMDDNAFYNVTLKNFATPWTNEAQTVFAPLNDYSAMVVGLVRDDEDFRQILHGNILYTSNVSGAPAYDSTGNNNDHFEYIEDNNVSLRDTLVRGVQDLPDEATAGVMTTRAAAQAFFSAGTNRAMFRFTLINHLCTDLEPLKDSSRPPDRIRKDVSRSPGGDSRVFMTNCVGCHAGMDAMAQAFAYYEYNYTNDDITNGSLTYNTTPVFNDILNEDSRVTRKHHINPTNFSAGFEIRDDAWNNYWRIGQNAILGWATSGDGSTGSGNGAKALGQELANSDAFASCQVKKVFKAVCLRDPETGDETTINNMEISFKADYNLKETFAEAASHCRGD